MGLYSSLWIDEHVIYDVKHFYPPGLDTLFRQDDYQPRTRDQDPEEEVLWDCLEADIPLVMFRLNISGYTVDRAREAYNRWRAVMSSPPSEPDYFQPAQLSAEFYERHNFDSYVHTLSSLLVGDRIHPPPDEEYLQSGGGGYLYQFPDEDPLVALSVAVHSTKGLRLGASLPVTDDAQPVKVQRNDALVILTEGKIDASYLERAFKCRSPKYASELRFLDHEFRPSSGAGEVVRLLKSLAAVGVAAPLLAIFDNDTAGNLALGEAMRLGLPSNFVLAAYPDIDLARSYPALGPSGLEYLNINGSACSLELYLGGEILKQGEGMSPIRWTGYEDKLQRYPGVVSNKAGILEAFERKLSVSEQRCETAGDWSGIDAILAEIVRASQHIRLNV